MQSDSDYSLRAIDFPVPAVVDWSASCLCCGLPHDCSIGEDAFDRVVRPAEVDGRRASALRSGDQRVQALFAVLVVFSLQLRGFNNEEMGALLAQLLGLDPATYPIGRMTYDLRRLGLHGISNAFRTPTATNSRRMACASRCSSPEPMPGSCGAKLAEIMPEAASVDGMQLFVSRVKTFLRHNISGVQTGGAFRDGCRRSG